MSMTQTLKNNWIPPENITQGKLYTFTFNPIIQPKGGGFRKWYRDQYVFFNKFKEYVLLILHVEASPSGRLHFHGFIRIYDIPNFILFMVPAINEFGSSEMDTCNDIITWTTYVNKQSEIWSNYINNSSNLIPYPVRIGSAECNLLAGVE